MIENKKLTEITGMPTVREIANSMWDDTEFLACVLDLAAATQEMISKKIKSELKKQGGVK